MNVVAALGSPREQGNTAVLLEQYLKGVMSLSTPVQLKTIYLQSQKIQSCTGCNVCERYEESKCVLKDSMQEIYKQIKNFFRPITCN